MVAKQANSELEAWLSTMRVSASKGTDTGTLRPQLDTQHPMLRDLACVGPNSSAAPIQVGPTLAEGGMGIVKVAEQKALGRQVVIKTLRDNYAKSAAEHVLREAWATGALEHPNIVPVHDIRVDASGAPVIVLKKIEGDAWSALMHSPEVLRERFGVTDVLAWNLDILRQVSQAIRYAHNRGILHRDLKPDNVMIGAFGEVYVVDWGIALSLEREEGCPLPLASESSEMAGTPCYLAPEMLGDRPLDARTDIYLLGAILFQILAARPPHRTDDLATLMKDIQDSSPQLPEDAPAGLREICLKAMAKDPGDRYPDASAFATALQNFSQTRVGQLLAEEAQGQLSALCDCMTADVIDDEEAYRHFGAVRFGFETALNAWPENQLAKQQLDMARGMMAEFELDRGNPQAALALLEGMYSESPSLRQRITDAQASEEAAKAELDRFRDDANLNLGGRTRLVLMAGFGAIWTVLPLIGYLRSVAIWRASYVHMLATTFILWLMAIAGWYWARASLTRTEINKRITLSMGALFPTQMLLFTGAMLMDLPLVHAELLMMMIWAAIAIGAVATVERRFWPTMLSYAAAFLLATTAPDKRYLIMAGANFVFMVNGLIIWTNPETKPRFRILEAHRRRKSGES